VNKISYSYRDDPTVPDFKDDKPIIVFDGYCVLCSGFANFILRHDKQKSLRLMAAQSELGEALYAHFELKPDDYSTNVTASNGLGAKINAIFRQSAKKTAFYNGKRLRLRV